MCRVRCLKLNSSFSYNQLLLLLMSKIIFYCHIRIIVNDEHLRVTSKYFFYS